MSRLFQNKRVILGVTGGIAAYKTIELVRQLVTSGAHVDVMMTESAKQFVTPLTFETLTRHPVRTDVWEQWTEAEAGHVTLAESADVMIIAPATANSLAKLAHGLADDMLTVSYLACPGPVVIAPAMDHHMYLHPATQRNIKILRDRGHSIIGPDEGALASGIVGHGRLVSPPVLFNAVRAELSREGDLHGKHVVISAGPTCESIDPIRFITNRSSGKMGYAIAEALADRGANVTLVSGPVDLTPSAHVTFVPVESASEMYQEVHAATQHADALVMAAAVADYTPESVASEKVKKADANLTIELTRTVDILKTINQPGLIKVGFAAETTNLINYATRKVQEKNLDLLIANDARTTMGADDSQAFLLKPGAEPEPVPSLSKNELAEIIVDRLQELLHERTHHSSEAHASTT